MDQQNLEMNLPQILTDEPTTGVQGLQFTQVDSFTTFKAEYAFEGDDIVYHFFLSKEDEPHWVNKGTRKYWLETFPKVLEPVVFQIFKVQPPRVKAAYVDDMGINSWWLKAYGFANSLDAEGLCSKLFETLDAALDATK